MLCFAHSFISNHITVDNYYYLLILSAIYYYLIIYFFLCQTKVYNIKWKKMGGGVGVAADRRISKFDCRRTQIFLKKVLTVAELIFVGDLDL